MPSLLSVWSADWMLDEQTKDKSWNLLDKKTAEIPLKEAIVVASDLNDHVGATKDGFSSHAGFVGHVTLVASESSNISPDSHNHNCKHEISKT
ncbi:unnamed protein product [Haemonchus placei]|uniref:Peptidase_S8 domain-containing protein n=1 Tax=Haemonchus placei TaxID=6290 RepID=A0A0N4WQ98_HAEPC|nr:unnamed protein product [Haemonchus placei]